MEQGFFIISRRSGFLYAQQFESLTAVHRVAQFSQLKKGKMDFLNCKNTVDFGSMILQLL